MHTHSVARLQCLYRERLKRAKKKPIRMKNINARVCHQQYVVTTLYMTEGVLAIGCVFDVSTIKNPPILDSANGCGHNFRFDSHSAIRICAVSLLQVCDYIPFRERITSTCEEFVLRNFCFVFVCIYIKICYTKCDNLSPLNIERPKSIFGSKKTDRPIFIYLS